jgi:hypothetical protein
MLALKRYSYASNFNSSKDKVVLLTKLVIITNNQMITVAISKYEIKNHR